MADRVFALVLILLAAAFWHESGDLPGPRGGAVLGPAFLPRVILGIIVGLAVVVLIQSFIKAEDAVRFTGIAGFLRLHWRVPALLGALAAYVALMGSIGFVFASIAFLLGAFALLIRDYTRGVVISSAVIAVGLPFGLDWLFETALRTFLP
ncbi:tripartite tricarboxylate transporter TctB family protein [Nesterenkonia flava]|uniref:Tripartite tricarboxylate transporter TctB family protein n=1 Tax=Nesterenkonia flava TaxID=469799 RepID=A0ABU1FVS2_9MICC|nr:tripartite tricarboxylate transporter TctB family protein [Nesterenkonia flava]MDR5712769.1 tripartite tricarboxylate transporter TctB family protein [Nesterenkonia flava]